MSLEYLHMDVFSCAPYRGNSLPVFLDASGLNAEQMLCLTQELRHFEAIFLEPTDQEHTVRARVFDLFEELPFAGHPVIGAPLPCTILLDARTPRPGGLNYLKRS